MSTKENEQKNTQENKKFQSQKTEKINSKSSTSKNYLSESSKQQKITENLYDKIFNDLIKKKSKLDDDIKKLENKKRLLMQDIDTNFSGQSENIATRVKGFQDYLTGALQNLSQSVEKLDLVSHRSSLLQLHLSSQVLV